MTFFILLLLFSNTYALLNHKWYVIGNKNDFPVNQPRKVTVNNIPISVWRNKQNQFAGVSDVCPHRGVSLAKGRVDPHTNCIVCPYHTFKYNQKGRLVQTPGQHKIRSRGSFNLKTDVPYYKILCENDWVYLYYQPFFEIYPLDPPAPQDIWIEPEANDPSFKFISLEKHFDIDARTVTENSLDILHISEVHTFGNKQKPLPISTHTQRINQQHVKVIYTYETAKTALPYSIYGINHLTIENEYILPHYTVARVKFGQFTNTIVTSALPIQNNKTKLFIKSYRNNWVYNIPPIDFIFDQLYLYLMKKTVNEDKNVIDYIYFKHRDGNYITKYDELIKMYRDDFHSILKY